MRVQLVTDFQLELQFFFCSFKRFQFQSCQACSPSLHIPAAAHGSHRASEGSCGHRQSTDTSGRFRSCLAEETPPEKRSLLQSRNVGVFMHLSGITLLEI